jgi:uncharacterized protein
VTEELNNTSAPVAPKKRGFGGMDPEKRKMISSLGGRAVRPENRSFSRNKDLARSAGKKGGSYSKTRTEDRGPDNVNPVS